MISTQKIKNTNRNYILLLSKKFSINISELEINSEIYLTQKQVKKLLPILTKFAETGEI